MVWNPTVLNSVRGLPIMRASSPNHLRCGSLSGNGVILILILHRTGRMK